MTGFRSIFTITYDGDGLRAWAGAGPSPFTGQPASRHFLYDGLVPVCELSSSGNVTAVNTWGETGLLARNSGGSSTFYTFDLQGSVAQRLGGGGSILASYAFDAFGNRQSTDGSSDPYSGFGGQYGYYTDSATGLELLTNRFYDPSTGRFLTRDPLGYDGGLNLYAYTADNPVDAIDPSGLSQDPGGGNNTIRLSLAAYIPVKTVGGFLGDNRNTSPNSPDLRVEQNVIVNLKYGTVHILAGRIGATHFASGRLAGTAPNEDIVGSYQRSSCGDYNITVVGSAGNPAFHGFAPPIQYNITITLDRNGKFKNIKGYHTGYPAFEIYRYQNGQATSQLWEYDPRWSNTDPFFGLSQGATVPIYR